MNETTDTSILDDLAAAEGQLEPQEPATEPQEAPEPEPAPDDSAEPGAPQEGAEEPGEGAEPKEEGEPEPPPAAEGEPEPKADPAPELRAPQSWKPSVREHWGKLPPDVQQEVLRREREIGRSLQETADARQFREGFQRAIQPYEGMLRGEGKEPLAAVGELLQVSQALRTAPPVHKAQLVASMIQTFGVPVEAIANALDGVPQQGQPQAAQQPPHDPRFDQFLASLEQQKAAQARAQQEEMATELSRFAEGKEFFEDLKPYMADILDVAARRGVSLSLEDAYTRAVQMHPDVSAVVKQREAAQAATATTAATQRSRNAATSVKSTPAKAPTGTEEPDDWRGAIAQAEAQLSGR